MNKIIAKTAFTASFISYGVFLLFEYLRPGFVQYVFSVHWFLIFIIICGVWLYYAEDRQEVGRRDIEREKDVRMSVVYILNTIIKFIIGSLLMVVLLREGQIFGDFRIVMALIGLTLPFIISRLLR